MWQIFLVLPVIHIPSFFFYNFTPVQNICISFIILMQLLIRCMHYLHNVFFIVSTCAANSFLKACIFFYNIKKKMQSCLVVSDSLQPHKLGPARLCCPWNSPGKNTRVGSHSFPALGYLCNPGIEPMSPAL